MFQNLRTGNTIYVLNKENGLSLEKGTIVNVSLPVPKYPLATTFGNQEMLVDVIVKINNQEITYQKLPANSDIADFGNTGIVLSASKEAINSEIISLKTKSEDIINSVDYHKSIINDCDKLLSELNPDFAERQKQQDEIKMLKEQISSVAESVSTLISELRKAKN